jgi:hypothetical protein
MSHRPTRRALIGFARASPIADCTTSPPRRFHVFAAEPEARLPSAERRLPMALGVGPLEVMDYLERPEPAVCRGPRGLELAEAVLAEERARPARRPAGR